MNSQDIIDAAVECFDLGPEDQEAVLMFGMKLEGISDWISVKDRLPGKGARVLVSDGLAVIYAEYRHYGEDKRTVAGFRPSSTGPVLDDVTHWMPLPTPPRP